MRIFKSDKPYSQLVSEAETKNVNEVPVLDTVKEYFKWVMFSHTWEGGEPTFHDVNSVDSVWKLDKKSPLNSKLCEFCAAVIALKYRWAWSDTCCIDKGTSAILSQSLISMYNWYAEAAETLVYLADVLPHTKNDTLRKSRWMTRAWTLQELLASKVIRFYNRLWLPYLNDMSSNHKESPDIVKELALAMGIPAQIITTVPPKEIEIRLKLRLSSERRATVQEDIAFSLIGIFSSDIVPRYGLGKDALGLLLESIVARSGDLSVIAWNGESSSYNSALPDSLSVFSQDPSSIAPANLAAQVEKLRPRLSRDDSLAFYDQVIQLPRPTFSNRRLHLPCIAFSVTGMATDSDKGGGLYCATVSLLGEVKFRTADKMPMKPRKHQLIFVHPWLRDLIDSPEVWAESGSDSDDESEDAPGSGSSPHADRSWVARKYTQALQLIVRLGQPFKALFLEQQPNGQYKRVAAEHEIVVQGVPYQTNHSLKGVRVKVVEIM